MYVLSLQMTTPSGMLHTFNSKSKHAVIAEFKTLLYSLCCLLLSRDTEADRAWRPVEKHFE